MSRGLTVEQQQFLTSIIEKENRQRLAWFLKHQPHLIEQQEEKLSRVVKPVPRLKRNVPDVGQPKIDTTDVMRPVDEEVRQLMSSGTIFIHLVFFIIYCCFIRCEEIFGKALRDSAESEILLQGK